MKSSSLTYIVLVLMMASVYSNSVLLALRLHLQSQSPTVRREVFRNLNYTTNMTTQQCSSDALCSQNNCDLVPKVFQVSKEVQKQLNASQSKIGWSCVQNETVDGICENGLMQKAVIKNRKVLKVANQSICDSNQTLNVKLVEAYDIGVKMPSALNDLCTKVSAGLFQCSGLIKVANVTVRAIIGGKSADLTFHVEWSVNTKVNVSATKQVNSTSQTVTLRDAKQTIGTSILHLDTEYPEKISAVFEQADVVSGPVFDKFFVGLTENDFKLDSTDASVAVTNLAGSFTFGNYKCQNFPLCKLYNCDRVLKTKSQGYWSYKWFSGALWITIPNNGYKCYNNKFNGCYAKKWAYKNVNYYDYRTSRCTQTVGTSLKFVKTSLQKITIDMKSIFNQCSVSDNTVRCYADASLKTRMAATSYSTETFTYTSTGKINFQLNMNSRYSLSLNESSVEYTQKTRSLNSNYCAAYLSYSSSLQKSIQKLITAQIEKDGLQELKNIAKSISSTHFATRTILSPASFDKQINGEKIEMASDVACGTNNICQANCELVNFDEQYLANITKTVTESNQLVHETHGWKCNKVLNNVTRCANDIYKQNQTLPETRQVIRNDAVCSSNSTPQISLDSLETVETILSNLTESCHTSEGQNKTQRMHCHNLNATSIWSINATAGGNINSTDLRTVFKLDLDFIISHDSDKNGTHKAMFSIDQTESNFGDVETIIEAPFIYKISQNEQWFNEMLEIVRDRVRKVVFSSVLDNQSIRNGFVTIGQ